ncbi:hypothetical protein KSF_039840 [Reticulibacter mediterranei]|uniref:SH3b domain-containing protein n=1 Tax=Reticulibacter mediterranei TaxID=2778369 RepID=A0A8J3IR94_9CHLR|nr:hypothetical protein [Reticulibacter mediterranei]GHO93936.1 hypothetical protein KSF_039840 [Reticulibacter mediterranei]
MRNRILLCLFVSAIAVISTLVSPNLPTSRAAVHTTAQAESASVTIYLDHRKVHDIDACATPTENCRVIEYVNAGSYQAKCQKQGDTVSDLGYTNNWWTDVLTPTGHWGWVTNIYIKGATKIAGVPDCTDAAPPPPSPSGVACTNKMAPLVRLYKEADKSSTCYNAVASPVETVSNVTYMCVNGSIKVTFEAPAGSAPTTLEGGGYYVEKTFSPATTIHITKIEEMGDGFHINYCHID